MKTLLCSLCLLLFNGSVHAADGRTITEGTNVVLAIGIDSRDFDIVRFYLRGNAVLELRADDLVIQTNRSVLPPVVRGGSTPVNSGETTKQIMFGQPMKDSTYIVLATPTGATTVSIPAASKTTNGFTINLTTGISGRVDWLAINP